MKKGALLIALSGLAGALIWIYIWGATNLSNIPTPLLSWPALVPVCICMGLALFVVSLGGVIEDNTADSLQ